MPRQLTARRVDGDLYDVTSETDRTYTDRCTWIELCQVADEDRVQQIDVQNAHRSDGELHRISYRPSPGVKFAEMPRPSMVRTEIVTEADKPTREDMAQGLHYLRSTLSRALARRR